jgi:hypothetical protein
MADLLVLTCLSCSNTELHFDATIPIHIYLSYTAKYYEHHKKKNGTATINYGLELEMGKN